MCAEALAPSERHAYKHNGRLIYEWDQTLTEVNLYIQVPPGVRAKNLTVDIKSTHLSVGIKGNPPYLDVSVWEPCLAHCTAASSLPYGILQKAQHHEPKSSCNLCNRCSST